MNTTTTTIGPNRAGMDSIGQALITIGAQALGKKILGSGDSDAMNIIRKVGAVLFEPGTKTSFSKVADQILQSNTDDRYLIGDLEQELTQPQASVLISKVEAARDVDMQREAEITERYITDMSGDSWLAKNIRPLACAILVVAFTVFAAFFLGNLRNLTEDQLKYGSGAIGAFGTLVTFILNFYIGSRKAEKLENIKNFYGAAFIKTMGGDR